MTAHAVTSDRERQAFGLGQFARAWRTHWSRASWNAGITFTTASGQRMTFARGQVRVVLTRR